MTFFYYVNNINEITTSRKNSRYKSDNKNTAWFNILFAKYDDYFTLFLQNHQNRLFARSVGINFNFEINEFPSQIHNSENEKNKVILRISRLVRRTRTRWDYLFIEIYWPVRLTIKRYLQSPVDDKFRVLFTKNCYSTKLRLKRKKKQEQQKKLWKTY